MTWNTGETRRKLYVNVAHPSDGTRIAAVVRTEPALPRFRTADACFLAAGEYTIGSAAPPQDRPFVHVDSSQLSHEHAKLCVGAPSWIVDLHSSNGTYVDGMRPWKG